MTVTFAVASVRPDALTVTTVLTDPRAATSLRFAGTVTAGVLVSVAIEVLQLVTGLIGGVTFRIADVNDVIFNATGVVLGYWLFDGFVRVCRGMPGLSGRTHAVSRARQIADGAADRR